MSPWPEGPAAEVALIDPEGFNRAWYRRRPGTKLFPHVGLGYLAANLERHGAQVRVLDAGVAVHREVQRFLSQPASLFGITAVSFTFRQALAAAQAVKSRYPAAPVILGGPHVSIDPQGCLADPAVDFALRGEGEEALVDFLEVLKRQPRPEPEILAAIPGLVYRANGEVRANEPVARLEHLDELPFPAWHLFPMRRYRQHPLLTSRGCPMECAFCAVERMWGRRWVHRDPDQVAAEAAWLRRHWGRKVIHVHDDNLTLSARHVEKLCDALRRHRVRVPWVAQGVRADALTFELLARMRAAGCLRVSLGLESADPGVLQAIGKRETPEQMAEAVRLCRRAGIAVLGMFMVGNPGDTEQTVADAVAFARRTEIDLPAFYMAIPYPGTRLWDYAQAHGRFLTADYLAFNHMSAEPVFDTPEFPADARRRAYRAAWRFCRRRLALYHLKFWWPPNLVRRNAFEVWSELKLLGKVLLWPGRKLAQAFRPRRKGENPA